MTGDDVQEERRGGVQARGRGSNVRGGGQSAGNVTNDIQNLVRSRRPAFVPPTFGGG